MRVLLADKLSDSCVSTLEEAGCEVHNLPTLTGESLQEALSEIVPHVLVVRSTRITEQMLDAGSKLELIVRAGAGYDTIDVDGASNRGIFVANCPGKNATAVAELTTGLILSLDRSIPDNVIDARDGHWNKAKYGKAAGVKGRTLGVIGLGNIGKEVVERARALEMKVVAWSRSLDQAKAADLGITRKETPVDVAAEADIVSLHVASTPETRHLAGTDLFDAMKPGTFFINTTREAVVDEEAMLKAISEKDIRVALDVFSDEPAYKEGELSHRLAENPNVYLTHHIGASTRQAQEAIAAEAARVITTYDDTGDVPNCVNMARHTPATHQITVRHLDKVGVLARVLHVMSDAGWNIQEMENLIFEGANAACAYIRFDGDMDPGVSNRIAALDDVLAVSTIEL